MVKSLDTLLCIDCSTQLPPHSRSDRKRCTPCQKLHARKVSNQWAKDNRERFNSNCRKARARHPAKRLWLGARYRAQKNDIPFNIEISDITIPQVCPVFGRPFEPHTSYAASLDRIDPSLGYVKGNINVISLKANAMKQDATIEELERFADWVKSSLH